MSFQGTLGPFVKGATIPVAARVTGVFVTAFLVGAVGVFGVAALAAAVLQVGEVPQAWRSACAAVCLGVLGSVEIVALRRRSYCPLSWRRQTPQGLRFRHGVTSTAALWGLDTGLAFTTFRVTTLTWAALLLTLLGLAPWSTGLAYGLAFALPTVMVMLGQPAASRSSRSLEALLRMRTRLQGASAVALAVSSVVLLAQVTG